ncbi:MAG: hypothetical protein GXO76_00440 [Calditrichaeota bacterium]|nr:hypothetical protein [Calditrichota bacterium]
MNRLKKGLFFQSVLLAAVLAIVLAGCGKSGKPVARVGNSSITQRQFEETFIKQRSIVAAQHATLEQKKNVLNGMIKHRLQVLEARAEGLDQKPEFIKKKKGFIDQTIFWAVMEADVIPQVIPESQIKTIWEHSNIDVKIRHILLKYSAKATQKEKDSTLALARDIVKRIRSGEDFSKLVEKYSGDLQSKKFGGNKGYVKWDQLDPQIRNKVFALKRYEISEPLQTHEGIEIIQVLERRIFPRKPYSIARSEILDGLMRQHTRELNRAYLNYWKHLQKKYKVVWFNRNIKLLADSLYFPRGHRVGKQFVPDTSSQFKKLSPKQMKLPLVKYTEKTYTINDFANMVSIGPHHRPRKPIRGAKGIRDILSNKLQREIIVVEGKRRHLIGKPRYQKQIRDWVDSQLYQAIRSKEILKKVVVNDSLAKIYYREHAGLYKIPPKVKVQAIMVKNKQLADKVYRLAVRGANFSGLAEKYNQMVITKKKKGMLGYISHNSYGLIGTEAFRAKVGEIRGPIVMGKNYYVIKILGKKPERQKTFNEARFDVERDLRSRLIKQREKEWMQELRQKMPVVIFEKNLENTFKEYTTDEI